MRIKGMMRKDAERYGIEHPKETESKQYDTGKAGDATFTYGEVRALVESSFGAYAQKKPYETSVKYEAKHAYKR